MTALLAAALLAAGAAPASAQGPADSFELAARRRRQRQEAPALALALDLAIGSATWTQVRLSTDGPVAEMTKLVSQGYYKLEIIQLILMSASGRHALKETLDLRRKGVPLAEIAGAYRLDYDKVYDAALALQQVLDREYLPRFPERRLRIERED